MKILTAALLAIPALVSSQAAFAQAASQIIPLPLNPVIETAKRSCSAKTPSGLGYTTLRPATAARPGDGDAVLINYIGYLANNGEVFDQGTGTPMQVSEVIPGFAEGLKLTAKGAITRVCIPSALGYGASGTGPIPANADLVFQVEVLDFKSMAEIQEMQKKADDAAAAAAAAGTSGAATGK